MLHPHDPDIYRQLVAARRDDLQRTAHIARLVREARAARREPSRRRHRRRH